MKTDIKNSYRNILKATGLFGGVQTIKIVLGLIQTKVITVLLGPVGVGIQSLLSTSITMISALTNLGIGYSGVRDVSSSLSTGDEQSIPKVSLTIRRWALFTGVLGAILTVFFSKQLSEWSFGNSNYTWSYVLLGSVVFFSSVSSGQNAIIQGLRKLNYLAKIGIFSSFFSLILTVPIIYFFKEDGIVPSLIITSLSLFVVTYYFFHKTKITKTDCPYSESFHNGIGMVKLGLFMTLSTFITAFTSYILNAYISKIGGINDVGFYRAGFLISTQYVGLIFTAISTDYFPRLSSMHTDRTMVTKSVNQQGELVLLILIPLLCLLIVANKLVINILYDKKFLVISSFLIFSLLAIPFKASAWCLSYVLLAKGNAVLFFVTEFISSILHLLLNIVGYKYAGLTGIGVSYLVAYIFYFFLEVIVNRRKYKIFFCGSFYFIFTMAILFCAICSAVMLILPPTFSYIIGGVVFCTSCVYALVEMNKRTDLIKCLRLKSH